MFRISKVTGLFLDVFLKERVKQVFLLKRGKEKLNESKNKREEQKQERVKKGRGIEEREKKRSAEEIKRE